MVSNRSFLPASQGKFTPPAQPSADILVVEDDPEIAEFLARTALGFFDKPALLARSLAEANAALDEHTPRIVLLDMMLPDGDGTELLLRLGNCPQTAVAVVTAAPSLYRATVAVRTRAVDFIVKPFTEEQLTAAFERLASRLGEIDEVVRLRRQVEQGAATQAELRTKIDILCRDLVGGYQKLLTKIVPGE